MNRIKFKGKTTMSHGKNGYLQTTGIEVYKSYQRLDEDNKKYDCIRIFPITSRDVAGNCWIEIPIPHIKDFIKQLEEYDNITGDSTIP